MANKITIIGAGQVGAALAYTLAVDGTASEIVLIDINQKKAFGEAMDIRQGTPYTSPLKIYSGDYSDAAGSDIVLITSGVARKPGQSRLDLAIVNVGIIKSIVPLITPVCPDAVYVMVANPVDILTYAFCRYSGIPSSRVIGTGTILDTARLRSRISEAFNIGMRNIHAVVLGEHGDTSFIPWSLCTVAGLSVEDYAKQDGIALEGDFALQNMAEYVKKSGGTIIEAKGATYYAISQCSNHICKCISRGIDTVLPVSSMLHGEYGISDVCMSTQNIINSNGVKSIIEAKMTDGELAKLRLSADTLKGVIRDIGI